jgi:hypothetical protein
MIHAAVTGHPYFVIGMPDVVHTSGLEDEDRKGVLHWLILAAPLDRSPEAGVRAGIQVMCASKLLCCRRERDFVRLQCNTAVVD